MDMNQDITFTVTVPASAVADVLAALAGIHVAPGDYSAADAPVETPLERAMRDGGDETPFEAPTELGWRQAVEVGTRHDPSKLAPNTGQCGTCAASYRWFEGEPRPHCACGGEVIDAPIAEPAPFGEVPGDIPFGDDHVDSGVEPEPRADTLPGRDDANAQAILEASVESDRIAAAADTFAMWLDQREYVSPAACAAFTAQDSSGHWRTRLFEAGFEEWADGSWHRAPTVERPSAFPTQADSDSA